VIAQVGVKGVAGLEKLQADRGGHTRARERSGAGDEGEATE